MLAQQPDATVTERKSQPPTAVTNGEKNDAKVDTSDAGAQRPIFLKTTSISPFAGLDSKYLFRTNPLSAADKLDFI